MEKDHLLVVEGAAVEEGGEEEGLEPLMGMDIRLLSMMMEVGMAIAAMQGAGIEEEVVTSMAMEGEGTMVPNLICSKMQVVTTKKPLLKVTMKKLLLEAVVLKSMKWILKDARDHGDRGGYCDSGWWYSWPHYSLRRSQVGTAELSIGIIRELKNYGFCSYSVANAWRALDAVGIGNFLREHYPLITRLQVTSSVSGFTSEIEPPDKQGRGNEGHCIRRKELLETLERELPHGTIWYSSKVVSIEDTGYHKLLHLVDGSTLKTKVLIGCDGVNSSVAKWLGLQKPVYSGRSAMRGFVKYPDGHGFQPRFHVYFEGGVCYGYLPCDDKCLYWFCTFNSSLQHDEDMQENPAKMKQFVLSKISQLPQRAAAVVELTELDSISCAPLKLRLPWNLLQGNISRGNVCVAGDALHPMAPDIGQSGCSALEDNVVLARCLAEALLKKPRNVIQNEEEYLRIEKGLDKFAKERRWRSFSLISAAYVVGFIQETDGRVMRFLREEFLSLFTVSSVWKMADFHCGELNISGSD